ncbi:MULTISPECIES: ExbD/TolR family protein [Pseudoalteromonas]|uniref:Biopolymer transporter ExbD n=1 Tax=Pseudoalteromonas obscura TaxID=3048491 RepID=A0ABT7EL43_9GAMM|nr:MULTISPECIES: biopolymer transporter ExbD [Pseudoalteromonas]MBQ4837640.1 biopolymer transporter ExbD [Pseudoalteromonas luteoviolacea]MDK2595779.1 biopolymer transporter ExbD [Pseudoalteromonas sp. P94(2023)]
MKHKNHTAAPSNTDVDMNPMLDIVFILLIFFIVTASFQKAHVLDLDRPNKANVALSQTLTPQFSIDQRNRIFLNQKQVDPDAIAVNIARLAAQGEITSISLKAHAMSEHNTLVTVLNAIKSQTDAPVALGS